MSYVDDQVLRCFYKQGFWVSWPHRILVQYSWVHEIWSDRMVCVAIRIAVVDKITCFKNVPLFVERIVIQSNISTISKQICNVFVVY
jgi:hypothetical protein